MPKRFSERHGIPLDEAPIRYRYEAPGELRQLVPVLMGKHGRNLRLINYYISQFLMMAEEGNWSDYPLREETARKLNSAPWYKAYELIEHVYTDLDAYRLRMDDCTAEEFQTDVNRFFLERGYGWKMTGGEIVARLESSEQLIVDKAQKSLADAGHTTAAREMREAMADLSKIPDPDLTGAVQHASAALECAARAVACEPSKTLGQLKGLFGAPLDSAVEKLWGYVSQSGRHISEGRDPTAREAIAVVGICATLIAALLEKES